MVNRKTRNEKDFRIVLFRIFGEAFCVFRTVVLEIVTSASILTVLCFTIERYLAICFPIISQKVLGGLNRAIKMIMIVWFLSFLLAVPYTFTAGINKLHLYS